MRGMAQSAGAMNCPLNCKANASVWRSCRWRSLVKQAEEEQQSGKKKPGRKPASPDAVVNHDHKANPTDPAIRITKTRQGHVRGSIPWR